MDVLDVMEGQHGHGPRCCQSQMRANNCATVSVLGILPVLQQRTVVVPEDDLRRVRCLKRNVTMKR